MALIIHWRHSLSIDSASFYTPPFGLLWKLVYSAAGHCLAPQHCHGDVTMCRKSLTSGWPTPSLSSFCYHGSTNDAITRLHLLLVGPLYVPWKHMIDQPQETAELMLIILLQEQMLLCLISSVMIYTTLQWDMLGDISGGRNVRHITVIKEPYYSKLSQHFGPIQGLHRWKLNPTSISTDEGPG